ncbi:Signal recognition particle 54 kDa like protein [Dictyocoela muelleri]|nr:Signal recognition particle 54 kDa like protein [Dictyocoela muelleri]
MISELGNSLSTTLQSLFKTNVTDEILEKTIHEICRELLIANVSPKQVSELRKNLEKLKSEKIPQGANKAKIVYNRVISELISLFDSKNKPVEIKKIDKNKVKRDIKNKEKEMGVRKCDVVDVFHNIVVFVGLQGAGKTTSICKYAHYYKKKGFKVGIVCADTFRAGAFDQIKQNCKKISVPYFGLDDPDPVYVAREGVNRFKKENFDLILIDTSGRHTLEEELFSEMKNLISEVKPTKIIFVMDASIGQSAEMQAMGFKNAVDVGSIILTKTDGAKKAGGALTSVAVTGCPIEFIGNGEDMDDFELFDAKRFVGKLLGKGDIETLIEKMKDLNIDEKGMIEKLQKGIFTMKDFKDQLKQLMSLGPFGKILEMIPGFKNGLKNLPIPDEKAFSRIIVIFDSFTKKELLSDATLFRKEPTRLMRIAIGSGSSLHEVAMVIQQYEQMSAMLKKIGSVPGFMNLINSNPNKLSLSQKEKLRRQAQNVLPKEFADQMTSFFNSQF